MTRIPGPLLVSAGALLWATDSPFRMAAMGKLSALELVTLEHFVGFAAISAVVAATCRRRALFALRPSEWASMIFIGMGASAAATLLFTASFAYIDPSLTILLQKLQPILVILAARLFLGERAPQRYWKWACLAFASAFVLSFPTFEFGFLATRPLTERPESARGALFAVAAAALWAGATVWGRHSLGRLAPATVTFWRSAFGTLSLLALLALQGQTPPVSLVAATPSLWGPLAYMGLVSGLGSMLLYYRGLAQTQASVATLMELVYPLAAVAINTVWLGSRLLPIQILAGALLLLSAYQVSRK